ncbi:HTH domain-containing protein [Thermococcus zilligii]|uniref:HTH domain-containing protein n=1 Tax=Thermococcus zilligii TaxID=54076 RepID=UPI00029A2A5D|nr:HTH domain-containing protein [Thermococcus zilligii]
MRPIKDSPAKRHILSRLREGKVSGESLARELGMSRVGVWKYIRELNSLGYLIRAERGYRLLKEPDVPYPWELSVRSVYFPKTGSTMEEALKLAWRGVYDVFVLAGEQVSGRGRFGRTWVSPPGGLYLSVVTRGRDPLALREEMAEVVAGSLSELLEVEAVENGLFVGGKKIGGVLVEVLGEPERPKVVAGIGLNVRNPVPEGATSLSRELGENVSLVAVAKLVTKAIAGELHDRGEER